MKALLASLAFALPALPPPAAGSPGSAHERAPPAPGGAGATTRLKVRLPKLSQGAPRGGAVRPSTANCTWREFDQDVDHFGGAAGRFKQRVCIYDAFWRPARLSGFAAAPAAARGPIFFYTGNESPLEEYVNNSGLMWEMGQRKGALLVWAEHRYEPQSHPCLQNSENCYGYCTTAQALADYAAIVTAIKAEFKAAEAPVVAFGGSYGGMLAGWFRIRYPGVIAGSIAASAPSWGLASTMQTDRLDWSARAVGRGVSAAGGATDRCLANLRAAWPLIDQVGRRPRGLAALGASMRTCAVPGSSKDLIDWAQAPWFLLAEGNYPFASTYITYAVGPGYVALPPWPMRVACARGLDADFGVTLEPLGPDDALHYRLRLGDLRVEVDWDQASGNALELTEEQLQASRVLELAAAVRDAVAVWYNVTEDVQCFELHPAPHVDLGRRGAGAASAPLADPLAQPSAELPPQHTAARGGQCPACPPCGEGCPACPVSDCEAGVCGYTEEVSKAFSWDGIVCNDDIWLYNTDVQGLGHDLYWPPSARRGATVADVVGPPGPVQGCGAPSAARGLAGAPKLKDPWSGWATAYYGGANISHVRNLVWSNGLLDPWSGGGVYPPGGGIFGPMRQNISLDGSHAALLIDLGAHHLDLFFADDADPPSARQVRQIEEEMIEQWCTEWYVTGTAPHGSRKAATYSALVV